MEFYGPTRDFILREKERFYILQIYKSISSTRKQEFYDNLIYILQNPKNVVIDCYYLKDLSFQIFSSINILKQILPTLQMKLKFINVNKPLKMKLDLYIESEENIYLSSLHEIIESFSFENNCFQGFSFVKAIVSSTMKTFFIQSYIIAKRGKSFTQKDNKNMIGDIGSFVKIIMEDKEYFALLSFETKTYLKIISKWLDEEYESIDETNQDAINELLNIIIGQSKSMLKEDKRNINVSFPTNYSLEEPAINFDKSTVFVIPFETEVGPLHFQIIFDNKYSLEDISNVILK